MSFNRFRVFFSMRYFYAEIDYFTHNTKAYIYITKANLKKVISNAYEVITCFILRRTNLNKVDKNGDTPLHRAINRIGSYTAVPRLIKCGADVHAVNRNGDTPLHGIVRWGMPRIMLLLIEHGADVNAVDKNGNTPLHRGILKAYGREECSVILRIQHERFSLLIEHGANVNTVNKDGITPLFNAVEKGNREIVALLIEKGANVNTVGKKGITPLFNAVEKGNPEIVDLLIKHGADVNAVDKYGSTPLFGKCNPEIADLLIKHEADVNAVNKYGSTPLFEKDNPETVALFLKHGAEINAINKWGSTPLFGKCNPETVALFLKHGADINVVNENGVTPLMGAVSRYSWYDGEQKKMILIIVRVLMLATLLDNVNVEKPDFVDRNQSISTLWSDCKVEIETFLSKVMFNSSSLSALLFLDLCKEKDENKLARISQNEEVKKILENVNYNTEKYPYFVEKIQAQFQKGLARSQALGTACSSIFTFNTHRELNADCWKEILKNLPQEDLKNVTRVASFFFKELPSNEGYNFSSSDIPESSKDVALMI